MDVFKTSRTRLGYARNGRSKKAVRHLRNVDRLGYISSRKPRDCNRCLTQTIHEIWIDRTVFAVKGAAEHRKMAENRKNTELSIQAWLKRACDRKTSQPKIF